MWLLFRYYQRRWLRAILLVLAVALGTAGLMATSAIIESFDDSQRAIFSQDGQWVQIVSPNIQLDGLAETLRDIAGVSDAVQGSKFSVSYPLFGIAYAGLPLLGVDDVADLTLLINAADVTLVAGRLPVQPGEAIVPPGFLKARNLDIGSVIGSNVSLQDARMGGPPEATVVGTVGGSTALAAMLTGERERSAASVSFLALLGPNPGLVERSLDQHLQGYLPGQLDVLGPAAVAHGNRLRRAEYRRIAWALTFLVALAIAVAAVATEWLDFQTRWTENALLQLMGRTRAFLLARSTVEVCGRSLLGWGLGTALGVQLGRALHQRLLEPRGMMVELSAADLVLTLVVPTVTIAAVVGLRVWAVGLDPAVSGQRRRQGVN